MLEAHACCSKIIISLDSQLLRSIVIQVMYVHVSHDFFALLYWHIAFHSAQLKALYYETLKP